VVVVRDCRAILARVVAIFFCVELGFDEQAETKMERVME